MGFRAAAGNRPGPPRPPPVTDPTDDPTPLLLTVAAAEAGARLDRWLADRLPAVGRRGARALCDAGRVRDGGGRRLPKATRVEAGHVVRVEGAAAAAGPRAAIPGDDPRVRVAHADGAVVVLDKPPGMATVPLAPGETGTVANVLAARFPETAAIDPVERGLLQRLDRDTSGLVAAARTPAAFERLLAARRAGAFRKTYVAVVAGAPAGPGVLDGPIEDAGRGRARVAAGGRSAQTRILDVTPVFGLPFPAALVRVEARTGARHQVRVHLAHAGHPLLGDAAYGGPAVPGLGRHALHAAGLVLPGAPGEAPVAVESPLPPDLGTLVDKGAGGG